MLLGMWDLPRPGIEPACIGSQILKTLDHQGSPIKLLLLIYRKGLLILNIDLVNTSVVALGFQGG